MLTNLLISMFSATLILAVAYLVIKPVLRKRFFNTPGVVEQLWVDEQTSVLVLTRPYTWFAGYADFERYAAERHRTDKTIDVLCYPSSHSKRDTIVTCYEQAEKNTRYNFQQIVNEEAGIFGVRSMAVLPEKPTQEALLNFIKKSRV